jgi:hypothetical protein
VKYEEVYLQDYGGMADAQWGLGLSLFLPAGSRGKTR